MVDILKQAGGSRIAGPLLTTPTPTQVSADSLSRPFSAVAQAVGFLGDKVDELSVPFNQADGANSVARNANGEVTYGMRLELSRGDKAYNAAAQSGAMANMKMDSQRYLQELRIKYDGRPEEFKAEADGYIKTIGKSTPLLRPFVQQDASALSGQYLDGLMRDKHDRDVSKANTDMVVLEKDRNQTLLSLSEQGLTGTDEYKRLLQQNEDSRAARAANPLMKYSTVQAETDKRQFDGEMISAAVTGASRRAVLSGQPLAKVLRDAEDTINASPLISPAEKYQALGRIRGALAGNAAVRSQLGQEAAAKSQAMRAAIDSGTSFNDNDVDARVAELSQYGRSQEARVLRQTAGMRRWMDANPSATVDDRLTYSEKLMNKAVQGPVAVGVGGNSSVIDRIIGVESGGDATAKNLLSSATGAGQFIEATWMQFIRDKKPEMVADRASALALRNNPAAAREAVDWYAQKNANELQAAGYSATPGNIYLAHFAGPAGAKAVLGSDRNASAESVLGAAVVSANPFLAGKTSGWVQDWSARKMQGVQSASSPQEPDMDPVWKETIQKERAWIDQTLTRTLTGVDEAFKNGGAPTEREMGDLVALVKRTGDPELKRKTLEVLKVHETAGKLKDLPGPLREQTTVAIQQAQSAGGLDRVERDAAKEFNRQSDALKKQRDDQPFQFVANNMKDLDPEMRKVAQASALPIDWSVDIRAQIVQRQRVAGVLQQREGVGARSLLTDADAVSLDAVIQSGDPKAIRGAFDGILSMGDDHLAATMERKSIKDLFNGSVRTGDANKFRSVMSGLTALRAKNSRVFDDFADETATKKVQEFESLYRNFTDEQLTAVLNRKDTGFTKEARETIMKQGEEQFKKLTPTQMIGEVDQRWFQSVRGSATVSPSIDPSKPLPPEGQTAMQMFVSDFGAVYKERLVALDGNHTAAVKSTRELLAKNWTVSSSAVSSGNNPQLMIAAPERAYGTIDGNHDWIGKEVDRVVRSRLNLTDAQKLDAEIRAEITGVAPLALRWRLVADATTEQEWRKSQEEPRDKNGGRATRPSYRVIYLDPKTGEHAFFPERIQLNRDAVAERRITDAQTETTKKDQARSTNKAERDRLRADPFVGLRNMASSISSNGGNQ